MTNLSDLKEVNIFGASMAGILRSTVSKVMRAFEKEGKASLQQQKSGRKWKLSHRERRNLTQNVRKDHKNTALKITAELNDHFENPVSLKTVWRELPLV